MIDYRTDENGFPVIEGLSVERYEPLQHRDGSTKGGPQTKGDAPLQASDFELTDWNPWRTTSGAIFPVDVLPDTVRHYVEQRATMTGADVSAYAMSALTGISASLDHRIVLKPKQHDSYYIPPVLWTLLCGDPSTRKSAPIGDVEAILQRMDRNAIDARSERVAALIIDGADEKDAEKKVPRARRRVITDITTEKLCDVLSHQNCGIGLFRDELSGWIGAMDKYGGGGRGVGSAQDRSVWIKAHASQPYTQDRKDGSRVIERLSCSILGAIQPDRLREMPALESDGLLQRFIPVVMARARPDRDEQTDPQIRDRFSDLLGSLSRLEQATLFRLSPEGTDVYMEFSRAMTEAAVLTDPSPHYGTFLGKLPRTLGTIGLLLHAVDVVEDRIAFSAEVPVDTVRRAQRIVEKFIILQGQQFYALMNQKSMQDTQSIAAALIKLAGKKITYSDLHHTCRALRGNGLQEVQRMLAIFDANGWVVPDNALPTNNHWSVNPALEGRFDGEMAELARVHKMVLERITRRV